MISPAAHVSPLPSQVVLQRNSNPLLLSNFSLSSAHPCGTSPRSMSRGPAVATLRSCGRCLLRSPALHGLRMVVTMAALQWRIVQKEWTQDTCPPIITDTIVTICGRDFQSRDVYGALPNAPITAQTHRVFRGAAAVLCGCATEQQQKPGVHIRARRAPGCRLSPLTSHHYHKMRVTGPSRTMCMAAPLSAAFIYVVVSQTATSAASLLRSPPWGSRTSPYGWMKLRSLTPNPSPTSRIPKSVASNPTAAWH
ncbi:unnamed protein product, partial [Ranitomeya imitator]